MAYILELTPSRKSTPQIEALHASCAPGERMPSNARAALRTALKASEGGKIEIDGKKLSVHAPRKVKVKVPPTPQQLEEWRLAGVSVVVLQEVEASLPATSALGNLHVKGVTLRRGGAARQLHLDQTTTAELERRGVLLRAVEVEEKKTEPRKPKKSEGGSE